MCVCVRVLCARALRGQRFSMNASYAQTHTHTLYEGLRETGRSLVVAALPLPMVPFLTGNDAVPLHGWLENLFTVVCVCVWGKLGNLPPLSFPSTAPTQPKPTKYFNAKCGKMVVNGFSGGRNSPLFIITTYGSGSYLGSIFLCTNYDKRARFFCLV